MAGRISRPEACQQPDQGEMTGILQASGVVRSEQSACKSVNYFIYLKNWNYTVMETSIFKNRYYFVILPVCVFILAACTKDYVTQCIEQGRVQEELPEYSFLLPVNLSTYNLLAATKSVDHPDSSFVFSYAMLDSLKAVQAEIKPGKVFTQTPLKGELFCRTGSVLLPSSGENAPDKIVQARLFHVKYEDCRQQTVSEFLVTMIPLQEQEQRDSSFSFLSMPGFSGTILFSDLSGRLMDLWYLAAGQVFSGSLEKEEYREEVARITFYTRGRNQAAQTKSGDGEDEEPQVDGGVLNECIIIAVYRDNGILDSYWDLVNYLDNNWLDDAIRPSPGGGGSDKPYQELTCTLTIVSKFCTGNSLTCQVQYVKGGQAAFTAVSSYNDSCIFHGWLFHGNLFSNSPDISVVMDDDYTYVAKYQSILNKDCYDLAKLSTDPLLKSKIDSLRTGTKQYKVEHGVAQRSDNSYYKMTAGTTGHIPMPQEPGIKYSGIYHTHPSGYCCVSGGDLVGLMICMMRGRYASLDHFHFGVVTGSDILTLKVKDLTALRNYAAQFSGMSSTDAAEEIQKKYIMPIINKMSGPNDYVFYLEKFIPYLGQLGIGIVYSTTQDGVQMWKGVALSPGGALLLENCLNN